MTDETSSVDGDNAWAGLAPAEDVRDFLSTARAHLTALFPAELLLRLQDHADAIDLEEHWATLVQHGYTAIGLPQAAGGIGELSDGIMLLEECGRALLPLPLMTSVAAGHIATAVGIAEEHEASTPTGVTLAAQELSENDTVSVFDGRSVNEVVLIIDSSSGLIIERRAVKERFVDPGPLDNSRATATVRLGPTLAGTSLPSGCLDEVLSRARLCVAADLLGVAGLSLDLAVSHALSREQFGQPIGAFQSVKHQLVDVHVALERARSLVRGAAAESSNTGGSARAISLSMLAKASAAEVAMKSTALRTQLLGAMGLTFESDNHLAVRRASQTAPFLGSARALFARAARHASEEDARNV